VRRDGLWRELFEGTEALDRFSDLVDLVMELREQVDSLQSQVDSLTIEANGWDEERVKSIEVTQEAILKGRVVFDEVNCKGDVIAYLEE
jgi:hypothetical protein